MKRDRALRVVFMGTPEFAVPSLRAIVDAGYDVPCVVTVPDRMKGRGRKVRSSAVKQAAQELGIPVLTPESLRDEEFLERLRALQPDVICVVAFRILPAAVFTIPSIGSFNLHGSLLPAYRGAAPINRALMNGEERTGLTTFFLKKKVDTGDLILQREVPIGGEMTAGELHDEMMVVGAELVVETLGLISSGNVETRQQEDHLASGAPKIFSEDCVIDWNRSAMDLHNLVRGLSPYPGAYTFLGSRRVKILRTRLCEYEVETPGRVAVEEERMIVGTGEGSLEVLQIQLEGKRSMEVADFLRGSVHVDGVVFSPVVTE